MPYPTSIQSFTFKRNNIDKVVADDVNSAYTEITEIERQLGGVVSGGIGVTTSTWGTGTFVSNVANWLASGKDGLAERLINIEAGLYQALVTASINGTTIPASKTLVTTDTTSLPNVTSVRGTTIPDSKTLITTDGTSVITGLGTLTNLVIGASAGSTAPLKLTSGTNLGTAQAGAIEYDGKTPYFTPVASNRGVLPVTHFYTVSSSGRALQSGGTATSAQSVFGVGITLAASTTYQFDMQISMSITGTTTSSNNVTSLLTYSGTPTSISGVAMGGIDDNTVSSKRYLSGSVVLYANTSATLISSTWRISGIIRTSTSGTFNPQLQLSGSNTNAFSILANSYIKITPLGTDTVPGVGAWA